MRRFESTGESDKGGFPNGVGVVSPQTPASAISTEFGPTMDELFLPPILAGGVTPENRARVESFYFSVASGFEAWVKRRRSEHTRRAYRGDVMAFVQFMNWSWPGEAS